MSEPRRLADETSVALERELLRAGIEDAPPSGAHERAATVLGIGIPVVAVTTATASVAPAAKAGVATSAASLKVVGFAVLALSVGAFVAIRAMSPRSEPAPPQASSTAVPVESAPSITPVVAPAPSEVAAVVSTGSAPPPPRRGATARPALSLGDEMALLDRARAALRDGDATTALRLVDEHDARFPGETFALESNVLRIDALDALGRSAAALAFADRFLAAHPNAPVSQHVRSVAERLRGGRGDSP